jgi:hypothetical protein
MITGKKHFALFAAGMLFMFNLAFAQTKPDLPSQQGPIHPNDRGRPKAEPPVIKKLGENLVQINSITVDTGKKEVSVIGHSMSDRVLEFIASTKEGAKLYESAIELDTDASTFNFALIMIGLDKKHGIAPREHFDKEASGDPVEISIEWKNGETNRRINIGELLYDLKTKKVPQLGEWVYTGSTMLEDGRFLAEMAGVIIGFVHDPASLIENSTGSGIGDYGSIRLNPQINLAPNTEVKLTVKALQKQAKPN